MSPIRHRSMQVQADRVRLKAMETFVRTRTGLNTHIRNLVIAFGIKLPACASTCFHKRVLEHLPDNLTSAIKPILETDGNISIVPEDLSKASGKPEQELMA